MNAVLFRAYTVLGFFLCAITNKIFPGVATNATHLTNASQSTSTAVPVTLTAQPTQINQTAGPTTASSVTSQPNITVLTTSKISFTSTTGEFTFQEPHKVLHNTHYHVYNCHFTIVLQW